LKTFIPSLSKGLGCLSPREEIVLIFNAKNQKITKIIKTFGLFAVIKLKIIKNNCLTIIARQLKQKMLPQFYIDYLKTYLPSFLLLTLQILVWLLQVRSSG
jgi:hypothetical protein